MKPKGYNKRLENYQPRDDGNTAGTVEKFDIIESPKYRT